MTEALKTKCVVYVQRFCGQIRQQRSEHLDETEHICETSGEGLRTECDLTQHQNDKMVSAANSRMKDEAVHDQAKIFECDICGKKYTLASSLRKHTRTVHLSKKLHKCDICGRAFSQKTHLLSHAVVHTGARAFERDVCGKKFTLQGSLGKHQKAVLLKEKDHVCHICGKAFFLKTKLQKHAVIHTGVKAFESDACRKKFTLLCYLIKHQKAVHLNEKHHVCQICGKAFSQKPYLSRHVVIHTGIKPFECEVCGKGFTQAPNLHKHLRTVHLKEKNYV